MTQRVILNPNNPEEMDMWKDVPVTDENGNPQVDSQGRLIYKRYVVRSGGGVSAETVTNMITAADQGNVKVTGNQTVAGNKSFTGEVTAVTQATSDDSTKVATTKFVHNITDDLTAKSNAISVVASEPANMEAGSGVMVPATDKITEDFNVNLAQLQTDFWGYKSTVDYPVGEYRNHNNNLYKCKTANGPSTVVVAPDAVPVNVGDPKGSDYWDLVPTKSYLENALGKHLGETVYSCIPLSDACLHEKDGALINGSGIYEGFVNRIASLYTANSNASFFTTEANWQASVTNFGFCTKFVYDSTNNTVRLPKANTEHGRLIKSYSNGADWYRIYEDGWCEQGGHSLQSSQYEASTVTLLKTYKDTNYTIVTSGSCGNSNFDQVNTSTNIASAGLATLFGGAVATYPITNSSFQVNGRFSINWMACGYIDTTNLQTSPIYEYIVIATTTKTNIEVDIDDVASDLNGKADKDFTNIDNTAKIAIAQNAMPSLVYDDLVLGSSGTRYTAPANGYVSLSKTSSASNQTIQMYLINASNQGLASNILYSSASTQVLSAILPVKKGNTFAISYTAGGATNNFRFIYAVGSESEHS